MHCNAFLLEIQIIKICNKDCHFCIALIAFEEFAPTKTCNDIVLKNLQQIRSKTVVIWIENKTL